MKLLHIVHSCGVKRHYLVLYTRSINTFGFDKIFKMQLQFRLTNTSATGDVKITTEIKTTLFQIIIAYISYARTLASEFLEI